MELEIRDPGQLVAFADLLLSSGRAAEARALLEPAIERARASAGSSPALLARASRVAEAQGRVADAARLLAEAMEAARGERAPLSRLRAEYGTLLRLRGELALRSSGEAREEALERALRTVAEWRALDPANPDLDRRAARLLFSVGRPERAWRYLTTSIERRPGEASAYRTAAEALEEEGRLERAERLWAEAAELEPTNPNWLFRRAQALSALGREGEARPLLERIAGGSWHERFAGTVTRAERLLEARAW